MKFVEAKVFLVSQTSINKEALQEYLGLIGAPEWKTDTDSDGEKIVEIAGRLCYRSFAKGLNPNVSRIREGNSAYIGNLLAQNHTSVLEHINLGFIIHNISRVATHELVRHRVGTAYSQESQRFVSFKEIPYSRVPGIEDIDVELMAFDDAYERLFAKLTGPFSKLKTLTSLFRRFLPQGVATTIFFTVNLRSLRNILVQRTSMGAEVEMRTIFNEVGQIARRLYPNVFQDFHINENKEWKIGN